MLCCFHSLIYVISTQTFGLALTTSVDNCAETKTAPSVACPFLAEFGGRCQKAKLGCGHLFEIRLWKKCEGPQMCYFLRHKKIPEFETIFCGHILHFSRAM